MDGVVSLISTTSTREKKIGMISVVVTAETTQGQLSEQVISTQNLCKDFEVLRFIGEQKRGWNKGLDVCVSVSPDTFSSEDKFRNWLVEVKKTQALTSGRLMVLVQSTVNREWFHEKCSDLTELQKCGVEVGLEVMGGMTDANEWKDAFPWETIQLNLNNCRGNFSQLVGFTSQMHMQGRKNIVINVHDRSELITMEEVYVDYVNGPVFGNSCLWSGPLSKTN